MEDKNKGKRKETFAIQPALIRGSCDCGEGHCCDGRPRSAVISPEKLLKELEGNRCNRNSCDACNEECGGRKVFIFA